jgi:hypothetical protein
VLDSHARCHRALVFTLVLYTAAELLWVQSQTTVEWTWTCALPVEATVHARCPPPPLYFWFIPLGFRADPAGASITSIGTDMVRSDNGTEWLFKWRVANNGGKGLPLKVKVWTPEGVPTR